MNPTPIDGLICSPELYPLALDPAADALQFVRLSEEEYAAASFHDGRMLPAGHGGEWLPWPDVAAAAAGLTRACHLIFHISHVGSTLLSRLLGRHPAFFCLREPAVLRQLAETGPPGGPELADRLDVLLALWSRTPAAGRTAVIKATSFASELARDLMRAAAGSRAVMMFVAPGTFLQAMLGGAMSDIDDLIGQRAARLDRRAGAVVGDPAGLSPGERVAVSWLCEMAALHEAAAEFPDRAHWVDFDGFLHRPAENLAAVLNHLRADADADTVARLLAGPEMTRYAKKPDEVYDADVRRQLLQAAGHQHAPEVERGMQWLRDAVGRSRYARQVVQTAASRWAPAPTSSR